MTLNTRKMWLFTFKSIVVKHTFIGGKLSLHFFVSEYSVDETFQKVPRTCISHKKSQSVESTGV